MSLPPAAARRMTPGVVVADRYVVERLIGRGGMGEVWEASDPKLGRSVALKIVAGSASAAAKRRLELEAKAIGSLEHPGIARLFDVVEHDDALVLVMELVRGMSLRESLQTGPVSPAEVARIARGTAEALTAAHARGLVHRDVKPDNVLVRTDGRTALLDFGVAKAITSDDEDALAATMTGDGAMMGTPAYVAPEQIRGAAVSGATDQFGLAVMAFELLTGELPWSGSAVPAIIASISSDAPKSVGEGFGGARERVDAVLARALAKAPADRFPDVIAFADALEAALGGSPVLRGAASSETHPDARRDLVTTADAPAPTAKPKSRRWRWLAGIAIALGAVATTGSLVATRSGARHARAAATATSASSTAGADAAAGPVTWDAFPVSDATTDDQRTAARAAARAFGRGDHGAARTAIDAALAKDPRFIGGQLLRAYLSFVLAADLDEPARTALAAAVAGRDRLAARDAALLEALEPSFLDPPQWHETAKRLDRFTQARPLDGQGWDALAYARVKLSDLAAAEKALARELEVDPRALEAVVLRAMILTARGEDEQAKRILEACVQLDGSATSCRISLGRLLIARGACEEADRVGRDALALAPTSANALAVRAGATAGAGASNDVIEAFLGERIKLLPPERQRAAQLETTFALATRVGDFPAALAALDTAPAADAGVSAAELTKLTMLRLHTLWEIGDRQKAANEAETYLRRTATRKLPERAGSDPTAILLAFLRATGRITAEEHASRRTAWIAAWRARRSEAEWRNEASSVWGSAFEPIGRPTPASAREALAEVGPMRVDLHPLSSPMQPTAGADFNGVTGALLLADGQEKDAERYLLAAANACRIVPDHEARLALGDLYAQRGDKARACAAYEVVEKAWGHAKPRSVTAEEARAGAKKLGCGAARGAQ